MVPLHRGDLRQDAARLPRERTRLNEHLRQVYVLNWAAIRFQSIDDNYASIFYMFMPLHIDLYRYISKLSISPISSSPSYYLVFNSHVSRKSTSDSTTDH